jgi:hypothetical protein
MRYPVQTLDTPRPCIEAIMVGLGAVMAGLLIGNWVIGPALSHKTPRAPVATEARLSYQDMIARPDPSPYRAATPLFDMSAQPHYGAMAREQARAELHRHSFAGGAAVHVAEEPVEIGRSQARSQASYPQAYYPVHDRHGIY